MIRTQISCRQTLGNEPVSVYLYVVDTSSPQDFSQTVLYLENLLYQQPVYFVKFLSLFVHS